MDKILAARNEYREQQWALVIKECADSGLTNKEYCRQHGISEKAIITGFESCGNRYANRQPHLISRFFARYPTPVARENPLEIAMPPMGYHYSQFLSNFRKFLRIFFATRENEIYIIRIYIQYFSSLSYMANGHDVSHFVKSFE